MDNRAIFDCPWCGEVLEVAVDLSAGRAQKYVEDCQVCCRPVVLIVRFDFEGLVHVEGTRESE